MINFNSILYSFSDMDSKSQILLFLIILVSLMLISIIIINYITKKKNERMIINDESSKKIKTLKQKINNSNDDIKPSIDLKKKSKVDIENVTSNESSKPIDTEDKKETTKKVEEVVEVTSKKATIDDIASLIESTLEKEPIDLTKFEEDQEENAIISYDELVKRAGAKKIIYKCEEDSNKNDVQGQSIVKTEDKKFQASKIISPVFGIQKEKEEKDEVLESFIDLEEFTFKNNDTIDEDKKDMDFLSSLKEFRSTLD